MNKVSSNVMELDLNALKPKKHIFISGSIGVGKTTVINNLKSQLKDNYGFIDELLGDDLIALSYDKNVEPQRSIELNLELKKFHQVIFNEYKGKQQTYIYDRGIVDPITFGTLFNKYSEDGCLKRELKYMRHLIKKDLSKAIKARSYLILLVDQVHNIEERILKRNRDFEKDLPIWLIEKFAKTYLKLARKFHFTNVFTINVNNLSQEAVAEKVKKLIGEINEQ